MTTPSSPTVQIIVLLVTLVVALVLVVVLVRQRSRRPVVPAPHVGTSGDPPLLAVVVNPTKVGRDDARRGRVDAAAADAGWAPPLWLDTTVEDPGTGQAAEAVRQRAGTVVAYGGDGTVRAVVAALIGTDVPLALLPAGTGNLLARNLAVPFHDTGAALAVALAGHVRRIDVGQVEVDHSGEDRDVTPRPFLVMAGFGFDADVMAAVDDTLKQRVGWWAYVVAGAANLRGSQTRVVIHLDDQAPLRRRVRSVVVGNCGELTGGVRLMPQARVDDGWLDMVVVTPRGVVGWAAVTAAVLTRSRRGHPVVEHFRCRRVELHAEHPLQVQLDGDPVGPARVLRVRLDTHALAVKAPPSP